MKSRLRQLMALAREFPYATGCILLMLIAGGTAWFFHRQDQELQITHDRVRHEGETMIAAIKSAGLLRREQADLEKALKEIDASLVTEDNLPENLGYFYRIEDQTHAHIADLHQIPAANSSDPRYRVVPVSLNITGSFPQVSDFLRHIETGPRLIKISSFSLHRLRPVGEDVALELNLEMLARP